MAFQRFAFILALACITPAAAEKPGPRPPRNDPRFFWSRGTAQGRGPVRFTHAPMRLEDIACIVPMGLMVGAHVTPSDHQYYEPKDREAGRYRYDVMAPADGFIVHIQHRDHMEGTSEAPRKYDEYRLVIEHSGTFWSYFDLITRLAPSVTGKLKQVPGKGRTVYCRIPVKGGQVIGKVGGQTLDLGVINSEVTLKGLLVPEHYDREPWKIHTVDPFDYFDEPLKRKLLALCLRKAEPRGGKIDHDIDGQLVGNWFKEGTNGYAGKGDPRGYWMGHLAITYHHIDPKRVVVSIGDFEGRPRQFWVKGNGPDPAKVSKESGLVNYVLVQPGPSDPRQPPLQGEVQVHGVLLARMLGDRRVKIEAFPAKSADEVKAFTRAAAIYER